ncbi:MAG: class I adenylate-forming enzyme family protein [Sporichthyaceae bacterium]
MTFVWGTEIARRDGDPAFLMYSPRRRHLTDLLVDAAIWRERVHLVQGERRLTFGDVFDRVEAGAALLAERGVRPGDRVLLQAANSPEWIVAMWAGIRAGAIMALGNGWWSAPETAHAINLLAPALVVADARRAQSCPPGTSVLDIAEFADPRPVGPPPQLPASHEDDPAVMVFTAGTTGAPKAAVLAHRSVIANLHNLLAVSGRLPHQLDPARAPVVNLQSGPLFHIGGLQSTLLNLLSGATVVFLSGRFDPVEVLDLIEREHVTVWGGVPTMAARVLEAPDIAERDLSSMRSISMGGAPVQPAVLARLREYFPNARKGMSTIYGMTETGGTVASADGTLMAEHPATSGRALPVVELRIEAPDSHGDGEIVVRTPGQLIGYWGEVQTDILDADGFVHTGDLGRIVDGLLFVTGRIKDLIIRGGENIAPTHVEAALLTHPQVRNAAVLGRPDADLGEVVGAVVEIEPGAALDPADLAAHVSPLLARFAVPTQWWIREDPLPVTDAGKTDKRALARDWPGVLSRPAYGRGSAPPRRTG